MTSHAVATPAAQDHAGSQEKLLFWACFCALIATAFGFIVRTQIMDEWKLQFGLSATQKGELFGAGMWPFAISIVLFSLIIDRIGYGKAMVFAFVGHIASAVITIFAPQLAGTPDSEGYNTRVYWILYLGTFICALANGTVEAVINPVVATLFAREKTKWLNILHAGWPGGLVLGGILAIGMGSADWRLKVGLLFIPTIAYGLLMLGKKFPVNERVAAGYSYMDMLKQVGFFGALLVTYMICSELARVLESLGVPIGQPILLAIVALLALGYGLYTKSLGNPLFVFLLLVMVPLATTELGTDTWITSLMEPAVKEFGKNINPGWVLIYTSLIMMILRFCAGNIVHRLSPLGLLALSATIAAIGLYCLSFSTGLLILAAATLYALGKTFFWPTMLGVVAEQFPQGGALTLNTIAGVGMLAVGVLGSPFFGKIQDGRIEQEMNNLLPGVYEKVVGTERISVFGAYRPIDDNKRDQLDAATKEKIGQIENSVRKETLKTVALFPCIMLASYLGLIVYFQTKGGYKPKIAITDKEEEALMAGGAPTADGF
jgi:MFS family permease